MALVLDHDASPTWLIARLLRSELPHINVLTKCDLIQDKSKLEKFLDPHVGDLIGELNEVNTLRNARNCMQQGYVARRSM